LRATSDRLELRNRELAACIEAMEQQQAAGASITAKQSRLAAQCADLEAHCLDLDAQCNSQEARKQQLVADVHALELVRTREEASLRAVTTRASEQEQRAAALASQAAVAAQQELQQADSRLHAVKAQIAERQRHLEDLLIRIAMHEQELSSLQMQQQRDAAPTACASTPAASGGVDAACQASERLRDRYGMADVDVEVLGALDAEQDELPNVIASFETLLAQQQQVRTAAVAITGWQIRATVHFAA
jgi:chromosome segregation ATPase